MRIFGAGIFEPFPQSRRSFKYGHKYVIKDAADADLVTSDIFEDDVECPEDQTEIEDHIIKHKFPNSPDGILVRAG